MKKCDHCGQAVQPDAESPTWGHDPIGDWIHVETNLYGCEADDQMLDTYATVEGTINAV